MISKMNYCRKKKINTANTKNKILFKPEVPLEIQGFRIVVYISAVKLKKS